MTREDKKKIERRAYWHDLLRQLRGTPDFPVKLFFHALFLVGAVYVATKQAILREQVKHIEFIFQVSAFLPLLGIIAGFLPNTQKKSVEETDKNAK